METFEYRDNAQEGKPVIFTCTAEGILKADKKYKAHTGLNVVSQSNISVTGSSWDKSIICPNP